MQQPTIKITLGEIDQEKGTRKMHLELNEVQGQTYDTLIGACISAADELIKKAQYEQGKEARLHAQQSPADSETT